MSARIMAIDAHQWRQIKASGARGFALCAGYPDLLVSIPTVWTRSDSAAVQTHHGIEHPMPDSRQAFREIGLELRVFDRERLEGTEEIADLNEPHDFGQFDLVIDPGTSEHCFNLPQAWKTLAGAVKPDGFISQALPMAMFNHGYWNINPVAMLDFYEGNGFEIVDCVMRHQWSVYKPVTRDRYVGVPDGTVVSLLARRREIRPFQWPQQKLAA